MSSISAAATGLAIDAHGLVKRFGDKTALGGIDLQVPVGTVTALLGPNGAGKTTAVRILTTLSRADEGTASVAGFDVVSHATDVRRRIGLTAQDATVDPLLTGVENLVLVGELHHLGRAAARRRARALLEEFSLQDAADRVAGGYSGGMRRRLDLAATLVADPEVLFLDEPTTGLDPRARAELWDVLDVLVARGTTILLTTQYLDEADRLADEIVVVDHGSVIARGDALALKRQVGGVQIQLVVSDSAQLPEAVQHLAHAAGAEPTVDAGARSATVAAHDGVAVLAGLAASLRDMGIGVDDLGLRHPTLDEVFLTLTGQPPPVRPGDASATSEEAR